MKGILDDIQSGKFASEFVQEFSSGGKAHFLAMRNQQAARLENKVGKELRSMMSWLQK